MFSSSSTIKTRLSTCPFVQTRLRSRKAQRNAAPPSSPSSVSRSPPHSKALRRAIDNPKPMPPFLNEMLGSNKAGPGLRAEARARIVYLHRKHLSVDRGPRHHHAAGLSRFRRILQEVGQHAFDQIGIGHRARDAPAPAATGTPPPDVPT